VRAAADSAGSRRVVILATMTGWRPVRRCGRQCLPFGNSIHCGSSAVPVGAWTPARPFARMPTKSSACERRSPSRRSASVSHVRSDHRRGSPDAARRGSLAARGRALTRRRPVCGDEVSAPCCLATCTSRRFARPHVRCAWDRHGGFRVGRPTARKSRVRARWQLLSQCLQALKYRDA
jgi:hypothetical protein